VLAQLSFLNSRARKGLAQEGSAWVRRFVRESMRVREAKTVLGRVVRERRREMGWSQQILSERAGLRRSYVSDVERGMRNLSLDTLCKLAEALGLSIPALFTANQGQGSVNHQEHNTENREDLSSL
jgi:ribosome-binding protein aMBF1 (putative translation factor)